MTNNPDSNSLPQVAGQLDIPATPMILFDQNEPRSLINLVPDAIRQRIQTALWDQEASGLFEMDEHRLYKSLRASSATPTPTDNRLRLKFWMEYDHCQGLHTKAIDITRVFSGICSKEYFYNHYLEHPKKVAWLLCPPTAYVVKANEALEFGLEQLRDILEADHTLPGGKIDSKLGELKLKIIAMLDVRVKGAIVQKTINANLSGPAAANAVNKAIAGPTMEELNRQLEALRKREAEYTNGGAVIEIQKA